MFTSVFARIPSSYEIAERLMSLEETSSSVTLSVAIVGLFAFIWLLYYSEKE